MTTAPKTKRMKRKAPAKRPQGFTAVYLSNVGQWRVDADLANRLFGAPRYTETEQAANPNAQMTRVIKDVAHVGRWKRGVDQSGEPEMLDMSLSMLADIEANFMAAKAEGIDFNLGKNHGDPTTGLIHPDNLIAAIDAVKLDGNILWASAYVSPSDVVYLSNSARKVSPGIRWRWLDGRGKRWPIQMVHVAVTDSPTIPGQGPFVALANVDQPTGDSEEIIAPDGDDPDQPAAIPTTEQELWDKALNLLGLPTLESLGNVTEENRLAVISALLQTLSADDEEDETEDPSDPSRTGQTLPALNPASGANMPAELNNTAGTPATPAAGAAPTAVDLSNINSTLQELLKGQKEGKEATDKQFADLSNRLTALETVNATSKKDAYVNRLKALAGAGSLTAAEVERETAIGEKLGWDLSNLDIYAGRKAVDLSNIAKGAATGDAPAVDGVAKPLTPEQIEKGVDLLIGPNRKKKDAA